MKLVLAGFTKFENIEAWQKLQILCHDIHRIMNNSELVKDYKPRDQNNGSSGSVIVTSQKALEEVDMPNLYSSSKSVACTSL